MRAGADARSVFEGTPPNPIPSSCRPSVPPGLLSEGGVSPALPLALPTLFPGAREEDWGSHLFLGNVFRVPETPNLPRVPHPLLPLPSRPFPGRALPPRLSLLLPSFLPLRNDYHGFRDGSAIKSAEFGRALVGTE